MSDREDTIVPPAQSAAAAGTKSVLIVDDDEGVTRALARVLGAAEFEVVVAADGAQAIEAIMTRGFDVILSDIQMPKMNGVELLRVVRGYDLDVPVILMTGNPKLETAIDAVSLGALMYLVKPTPKQELLAAVTKASRLHRMAQMKRTALKLLGETGAEAGDRAGLEASFERGLASLWIAFQPVVDVGNRSVFGYEALLRTREPSLLSPRAMLGAAERLDRLRELARRVRALAVQEFARAPADASLFLNLHTMDLLDQDLFEVDSPLMRMANRVVLEISERAAIDDIKDVQARVSILRYHGFRIAVDDLGAGYAGLSSFVALEPDIVKLDASLIRNAHQSEIRQRLVDSMTSLCREMDMRVIAEGVQLVEECDCLRSAGCQLFQGYLFANPGPAFPEVRTFG